MPAGRSASATWGSNETPTCASYFRRRRLLVCGRAREECPQGFRAAFQVGALAQRLLALRFQPVHRLLRCRQRRLTPVFRGLPAFRLSLKRLRILLQGRQAGGAVTLLLAHVLQLLGGFRGAREHRFSLAFRIVDGSSEAAQPCGDANTFLPQPLQNSLRLLTGLLFGRDSVF